MKLILASGSPRRRELLSHFPFEIEIIKPETDEVVDPSLTPDKVVESLALEKAEAVKEIAGDDNPLVAADTVVVLGEKILGKPASKEDAFSMVTALSGNKHYVYTGVAVIWKDSVNLFSVKSGVIFNTLTNKEIEDYISTEEPYDKAGAYALQGLGSFMVKEVMGSYSNVIGLPMTELVKSLNSIGFLNGLKLK